MAEKQKYNFMAEIWSVYVIGKYKITTYRVIPAPESEIGEYYMVTIDTGVCDTYNEEILICETVVGAGVNPWQALMNAADAWDRSGDGRINPFRQIVESIDS